MAQIMEMQSLRKRLTEYYRDHGELPNIGVVQKEWGFDIDLKDLCRERERIISHTGSDQNRI